MNVISLLIGCVCVAGAGAADERFQGFEADPGWEGRNNRPLGEARRVVQNFGYRRSANAGGGVGEVGGTITPASEAAYYAKALPVRSFDDGLTASGTFACPDGAYHVLLGFFNSKTVNEWRTPNSVALRLNGRGSEFYAYVEYATSRWRAGGDSPQPFPTRTDETGRAQFVGFRSGLVPHRWTLTYDPNGNDGGGSVTATIDGATAVCNVDSGHKADGATFDRFGLLNIVKSVDGGGEVWIDDVTIDGESEDFTDDPGWVGVGNVRDYVTQDARPRWDFGYSATNLAGGEQAGEIGGRVFRGDCRYETSLASYADRIGTLSLDRPLRASGKVSLRRGVSDSSVLIGFFHDQESMKVNESQAIGMPKNFLGVMVEGPSRDGFFFAPAYRGRDNQHVCGSSAGPPTILPDGATHDWTLEYDPTGADGRGRIKVTLDGREVSMELGGSERASGVEFNRFGLVTTWIDGNAQVLYLDDLRYTAEQ